MLIFINADVTCVAQYAKKCWVNAGDCNKEIHATTVPVDIVNPNEVVTMSYKTKLFNSLSVTRDARTNANDDDNMLSDLMANPEYLRHSSSIINDALKDGFDVLQLPNGDIVTTGTKTIVNTFVWDASKSSLDKVRTTSDKPRARKTKMKAEAEEDAE